LFLAPAFNAGFVHPRHAEVPAGQVIHNPADCLAPETIIEFSTVFVELKLAGLPPKVREPTRLKKPKPIWSVSFCHHRPTAR
jgi:hypothetical protein